MKLENRVAIVTGASRGIGRALALNLAREGADVALAARTESRLTGLAEEIRGMGPKAIGVPADISKEEDVKALVDRTLEELGAIDILFNGAGVGYVGSVVEMPVEQWDQTFSVNLRGTFLCCKYALPSMIDRQYGSIINVASADRGYATKSAYLASKFGVVAFTQALAEEVKPYNIAVNCVRFGVIVDTELARDVNPEIEDRSSWQRPEDVTDVLVFLATQDATGVTGGYVNTLEWQQQMRGPLHSAATAPPSA